ncbi:MAG: gamma-glutamyltransferase [archaeon]|nr:gamma-glutamyltransferase [archaeon]
MRYKGVHAVTIPGAVHSWVSMNERWGSLPLKEVLEPAIHLASEGHAVSPLVSLCWRASEGLLGASPNGSELLIREGGRLRAPLVGELVRQPGLAKVLQLVAERGSPGFYDGEVAEAIVEVLTSHGGVMTREDLASHVTRFCEPIETSYRGFRVLEIPPPGQGVAALEALNILEQLDARALHASDEAKYWHASIEAMRLALADLHAHIGDACHPSTTARLLSKQHAAQLAKRVSMEAAAPAGSAGEAGEALRSDTICFSVTDRHGNAVSFIQSNYAGFGTGIVPKGCGMSLHNRGSGFGLLDPSHPNHLRGGAFPLHSIIPGMVLRSDGRFYCAFGNMGGAMQPQGHLQLLSKLIDLRLSPKHAVSLPRWYVDHDSPDAVERLKLEHGTPAHVAAALAALGHRISPDSPVAALGRLVFGRAHVILRLGRVEYGACETRSDGLCIALSSL